MPAGDQPGSGYLQHLPDLHQLGQPDRGRGDEQAHPAGQAVGEGRGVRLGHITATGDAPGGDDEVLAGEQPQGLPHGAAADPGAQA